MRQPFIILKWWDGVLIQQHNLLHTQLVDTFSLNPKKFIFTRAFLHQKYVVEGLSSREIAAQTFSSRATVTRRLHEFRIPLKTVTRRETGGQVYGYRKYLGMSVPVKSEQKVIALIRSKRLQKWSYQKISDYLNRVKVKTKHSTGIWYPKVIRQIYMRDCNAEGKNSSNFIK